eukprot:Rmarinus@m.13286
MDCMDDDCRICRLPASETRPLLTPCLCSGTMRCVHQSCLLSWLKRSGRNRCDVCLQEYKIDVVESPWSFQKEEFFGVLLEMLFFYASFCVKALFFLFGPGVLIYRTPPHDFIVERMPFEWPLPEALKRCASMICYSLSVYTILALLFMLAQQAYQAFEETRNSLQRHGGGQPVTISRIARVYLKALIIMCCHAVVLTTCLGISLDFLSMEYTGRTPSDMARGIASNYFLWLALYWLAGALLCSRIVSTVTSLFEFVNPWLLRPFQHIVDPEQKIMRHFAVSSNFHLCISVVMTCIFLGTCLLFIVRLPVLICTTVVSSLFPMHISFSHPWRDALVLFSIMECVPRTSEDQYLAQMKVILRWWVSLCSNALGVGDVVLLPSGVSGDTTTAPPETPQGDGSNEDSRTCTTQQQHQSVSGAANLHDTTDISDDSDNFTVRNADDSVSQSDPSTSENRTSRKPSWGQKVQEIGGYIVVVKLLLVLLLLLLFETLQETVLNIVIAAFAYPVADVVGFLRTDGKPNLYSLMIASSLVSGLYTLCFRAAKAWCADGEREGSTVNSRITSCLDEVGSCLRIVRNKLVISAIWAVAVSWVAGYIVFAVFVWPAQVHAEMPLLKDHVVIGWVGFVISTIATWVGVAGYLGNWVQEIIQQLDGLLDLEPRGLSRISSMLAYALWATIFANIGPQMLCLMLNFSEENAAYVGIFSPPVIYAATAVVLFVRHWTNLMASKFGELKESHMVIRNFDGSLPSFVQPEMAPSKPIPGAHLERSRISEALELRNRRAEAMSMSSSESSNVGEESGSVLYNADSSG